MDKENIVWVCVYMHTYHGMLLSHKEKWNYVICRKVDGNGAHHVEWFKTIFTYYSWLSVCVNSISANSTNKNIGIKIIVSVKNLISIINMQAPLNVIIF
jgi:hypothetical protein